MLTYSVGDHVKVQWDEMLHGARVLTVHATAKVDVAYDVDNKVCIFLSAAAAAAH